MWEKEKDNYLNDDKLSRRIRRDLKKNKKKEKRRWYDEDDFDAESQESIGQPQETISNERGEEERWTQAN